MVNLFTYQLYGKVMPEKYININILSINYIGYVKNDTFTF